MKNFRLNLLTNELESTGILTARLDTLAILEHTLGMSRATILAEANNLHASDQQWAYLRNFIDARRSGVPLAYILNTKEFYGRSFYVDSNVLIPRPESEDMITLALGLGLPRDTNVIDIGTGSGILGITYALECGVDVEVLLTDISPSALNVARRNSETYKVNAQLLEADLLTDSTGKINSHADGLLFANLPYVPDGLVTSREIEKEPRLALFSGEYGLDHYRMFWDQVSTLKIKPRYVIAECLKTQLEGLDKLASAYGFKTSSSSGLIRCYEPATHN